MAYDRDEIFQAIGKEIARFNYLEGVYDDLDTIWSEEVVVLNVSEDTRDLLDEAADTHADQRETTQDMRAAIKANVSSYLTNQVRDMLAVVPNTVAEVLDALQDAMYIAGDSVLENVIPPLEYPAPGVLDDAFDIDNDGVGYLYPDYFHGQQTHHETEFIFECIAVTTTPGEETWSVKCKRANGTIENLGTVVTGDVFYTEKYGLQFHIEIVAAIEEANDGANQLSNWVLTGATKRKGDEETEPITVANASWYGVYYVELTDAAGTRTVDLYRDAAKTELVATGSRAGDGAIVLAAAGGSGLNGSVDVAYTGNDLDITLRYPFVFAVGDRAYFVSEVTTPAIFQTFFVEQYDKALPSETTPAETVDEDWATWGP